MSDRGAIAAVGCEAVAEYGPIGLVSANVGIALLAGIGRKPSEEWDELIDIKVKGVLNTVLAVMRCRMIHREVIGKSLWR